MAAVAEAVVRRDNQRSAKQIQLYLLSTFLVGPDISDVGCADRESYAAPNPRPLGQVSVLLASRCLPGQYQAYK